MSNQKRITERSNELTKSIDTGGAEDILAALCRSDDQIFEGFEDYDSLQSPSILAFIEELISSSADLLEATLTGKENNVIVFSGSGTSGRMAWLCARTFNRLLSQRGLSPCFAYCISGGDEALIVSKELPEDSPALGVQDLLERVNGKDRALVVGITCGLSAPYVAGQLDWALKQDHATPCLIGFNPVAIARDDVVENWDKTCRGVFTELEAVSAARAEDGGGGWQGFVINPVVGPEPITGSTRMKGGSATKILLEVVFILAIEKVLSSSQLAHLLSNPTSVGELTEAKKARPTGPVSTADAISLYRQACTCMYRASEQVARVLQSAAESLSRGGHLYYVGSDAFALLGLIDASEMVDTFGAGHDEVRGFVEDGWQICDNNQGDLSLCGSPFKMSLSHFTEHQLGALTENDTVVLLLGDVVSEPVTRVWRSVVASRAKLAEVRVSCTASDTTSTPSSRDRDCTSVSVLLPFAKNSTFRYVLEQFAMKLVLNAVSTGANIMKGRVFGNTMVNLTVSNNKLYFRSVGIVREMAGVSEEEAVVALHRSIYRDQPGSVESTMHKLVSDHIKAGKRHQMVVPLAILLATGQYSSVEVESVAKAMAQLSSAASLRQMLQASRHNE